MTGGTADLFESLDVAGSSSIVATMVPIGRAALLSIVVRPPVAGRSVLDHHGPHSPIEWAIYVILVAVLVVVLVVALRQSQGERR